VEDAMINDELHTIIDRSAGEWPFVQVQQLARIAMRCAAEKRRRRADLVTDVWPVVETMMKNASLSACPSTSSSIQDESSVPHYFLCPILQVLVLLHIESFYLHDSYFHSTEIVLTYSYGCC
jgi:hypothetical protein